MRCRRCASSATDFELVLVGDRERSRRSLALCGGPPSTPPRILHVPDRIEPGEPPAAAVRRKPESSIVAGLELQREGRADAFVSAGSTGAVMAASLLILRPVPGWTDRRWRRASRRRGTGGAGGCRRERGLQARSPTPVRAPRRGVRGGCDAPAAAAGGPAQHRRGAGEGRRTGGRDAPGLSRRAGSTSSATSRAATSSAASATCLVDATASSGNVLLKFYESVAGSSVGLLARELGRERDRARLERVPRCSTTPSTAARRCSGSTAFPSSVTAGPAACDQERDPRGLPGGRGSMHGHDRRSRRPPRRRHGRRVDGEATPTTERLAEGA